MKFEHLILTFASVLPLAGCDKGARVPQSNTAAAPTVSQPATGPTRTFRAQGQVIQANFTKAGQGFSAVIDTEDMPGFMAAMPMEYRLADPADAARLKPGEKITFDLAEQPEGDFAITHIHELPAVTPLKLAPASQPTM